MFLIEHAKNFYIAKENKSKEENDILLYNLQREYRLLQTMRYSNEKIRDRNIDSTTRYMDNNYSKRHYNKIFTSPEDRAKEIAEEYEQIIKEFFVEGGAKTFVRELAYRIPAIDDVWRPIGDSTKSLYSPEQLARNPRSTYWSVINGNEFAFINDKDKVAKSLQNLSDEDVEKLDIKIPRYLPNKSEIGADHIPGSIMTKYFAVAANSKSDKKPKYYIEAILSISSMDKKFVSNKSENEMRVLEPIIKDYILSNYEDKLKLELSVLFLKKINDAKKEIIGKWTNGEHVIQFKKNGDCDISGALSTSPKKYVMLNNLTLGFEKKSKPPIYFDRFIGKNTSEVKENEYYLNSNSLKICNTEYTKIE